MKYLEGYIIISYLNEFGDKDVRLIKQLKKF